MLLHDISHVNTNPHSPLLRHVTSLFSSYKTWYPGFIALNAAEAGTDAYGRIIMGTEDIDKVL